MPRVYSRFDPPPKIDAAKPTGKDDKGADQSFQKEADINVIMARFEKTGYMVDPSRKPRGMPFFEDVSMAPETFMEAQEGILRAKKAFDDLPSQLRTMFENSPAALLKWLDDEGNHDQARAWGLMERLPEEPQKEPETAPEGTSR